MNNLSFHEAVESDHRGHTPISILPLGLVKLDVFFNLSFNR